MRVLVACEYSGTVRDAFRRNGHDAWSCDIIPSTADPRWHYIGNVLHVLNDGWDLMIAHPPCTYLTFAANRSHRPHMPGYTERVEKRKLAMEFFMKFANANIPRIAIENPSGVMTREYRKANQEIHPHQFGHTERKRTQLWLKNLPLLQWTSQCASSMRDAACGNSPAGVTHWYKPRKHLGEAWAVRSKTFAGIAAAMANQWGNPYNLPPLQ